MKIGLAVDYLDGTLPLRENFNILVRLVEAAREAGFDLTYHPHHFMEADSARFQPLPALSRLAADSGEMLLVWADLLPLNHPVRVAEEFATLDVITNGRAILLGVLGYQSSEFDAFLVDRTERAARLRGSYEIIARLLAGEEVTSTSSQFQLDGQKLGGLLKPVAQPRPPIWVTAHNNQGVKRAAASGDAWFISHQPTLGELRQQIALYRSERANRVAAPFHAHDSHGIHLPLMREAFVADTTKDALTSAEGPMMESVGEYLRSDQMSELNDPSGYRQPFDSWRIDRAFIGDPVEVLHQIRTFRDELGVDCIVLKLHRRGIPFERVLHAVKLVGSDIIPSLRTPRGK